MSKRIAHNNQPSFYANPPKNLDDDIFYGLQLDDEQKAFRDAIWNEDVRIVFCNAKAGTGKTTIAIGVANLLYQYGLYNGINYIVYPTQEQKQGFMPGDLTAKTEPYMEPLYEALLAIGVNPMQAVVGMDSSFNSVKNGQTYIQCMPHTFLRGCNFENKVVISDETQNGYISEIKKVLTRAHDNSKMIIIGHSEQKDLYKHSENSGFTKAIELFASKNDPRVAICNLTHNYRGWISTIADELESEIK